MERLSKEPRTQDPYRMQGKPRGNAHCPSCGSYNLAGTWTPAAQVLKKARKGANIPLNTREMKCPACQMAQAGYAQGVVEIIGSAWRDVADQVFETVNRTESVARSRNDQQRVIGTRTFRGSTKIYCTIPDLAQHIGRVLGRSFKGLGEIEYKWSTEEPFLYVYWYTEGKPAERRRKASRVSKSWRGRGMRTGRRA